MYFFHFFFFSLHYFIYLLLLLLHTTIQLACFVLYFICAVKCIVLLQLHELWTSRTFVRAIVVFACHIIFTVIHDCHTVHGYCPVAEFACTLSTLLWMLLFMHLIYIWMLLLAPYRHNNSTVSATCGNKYNAICLCLLCVEFWKAKSGLFLFLFLSRTKTMICFMFHLCICI